MNNDYWVRWWKAAAVRSIKTIAQTALSVIGVGSLVSFAEVDWLYVVSVSFVAGVLSLLTSIAGLPEVKVDDTE